MIEGTRRAMIVGINQYKDDRIPPLKGAENDAQDLYERLTDPNIGNFEIQDNHFLLGEQATAERIRKAISDLFWKTDHADLTLFYFSGHGFVDSYGDGYMAPYDFCEDELFVCGTNLREFKQMLSRSQSASVVVILDCCYSGITTKDDKALRDYRAEYEANLKDLSGEGRVILASSTPDQVSREKDLKLPDGKRRQRGMFTHYLLTGLDGDASDEQGIISIATLQGYIEKKFTGKKQTPRFFVEGSNLSSIKLAIATGRYNDYIDAKITKAKDYIDRKSFASLLGARTSVLEVLDLNAQHKEALELKDTIAKTLDSQKALTSHWVTTNELDIRPPLEHVFRDFEGLIDKSNFDAISSLSKDELILLNLLHSASMGELNLTQFIQKCVPWTAASRPDSAPPPLIADSKASPTPPPSAPPRRESEPRVISPTAEPEPVYLGASAPQSARPGDHFTARFVAYIKDVEKEVESTLARLSQRAADHLGLKRCRWQLGTPVKVRIYGHHLVVNDPEDGFDWDGQSVMLDFDVQVSADAPELVTILRFDVLIDDIVIAKLRLDLEIGVQTAKAVRTIKGEPARTAFASYASKDRQRVLDRIAEIRRNGVDVFVDCLSLHPGEAWKQRLEQEILQRDLFMLFWSANAKQSEWVTWEWQTALKHRGLEGIDPHPLDPVDLASPPQELSELHFGDPHMVIRSAYAQAGNQTQ